MVKLKMAVSEVCRLCLAAEDLLWVFDERFESSDSMKEVVYTTTGVQITTKDIISQKICEKCCQVTVKMFEFRRTSLKNDQFLRDQWTKSLAEKAMKIPNTQVIIRSEPKKIADKKTEIKEGEATSESKPTYKIHPSVRELFKIYPQIKLPTVCLKYNIAPAVAMPMDAVEQYFHERKLDFQQHTKQALRAGKVATKRTSGIMKAKNVIPKGLVPKPKTEKKLTPEVPSLKIKIPFATPSGSTSIISTPQVNMQTKDTNNVEATQNDHSYSSPVENKPTAIKRKFSEIATPTKEVKSDFIESLGLTAKVQSPQSGTFVANKSLPVQICEICNSVQYSAKDLRRHQNKHLRCQFCKLKFRSLENKKEHLDADCSIKNMMNNLPKVQLEKVEFILSARRRYPNAFVNFPALVKEVDHIDDGSRENSNCSIETKYTIPKPHEPIKTSEVIEILSDEEEPSSSVPTKSPPPPQAPLPVENIVYNTVSIVRPDIKIKGSNALEMIDARLTDIKILKELLTNYRPVPICVNKFVQTELPSNNIISINHVDTSAELRLLKPQLYVYKVPIVMKNGSFGVYFDFTPRNTSPKKMCLWNDLTAFDIKPPKRKIDNPILPSTGNYNFTGVLSSPSQATPGKFIRVSTSSLSPITTTVTLNPSPDLINKNPMLNSFLQDNTPTTMETTDSGAAPNAEVSNTPERPPSFGSIRVKNVWELT